LHYVNEACPYEENSWLAMLATSRYQLPGCLIDLIEANYNGSYATGNSRIILNIIRHIRLKMLIGVIQ
jgi:hypothetical protein